MGLEKMIATMPKKRLTLLKNLVSVGVIFSILYATITIASKYTNNPLNFLKSAEFMHTALILILLSVVWKLLNGASFTFKNQNKTVDNQNKPNRKQSYQQPKKSNLNGSWRCPNCNTFAMGNKCPKCGYEK